MANGFLDLVGTPMLMATGTNTMTVGTNGTGNLRLKSLGSVVAEGRFVERLTATDVDAQNNTLTVAQIAGGIVVHTSVTGGGTVTTDTAANIVAGSSSVGALTTNGDAISMRYINDGSQTLTFAGGTGVTIADTGATILTNQAADVVFLRVSASAVTCYVMGAP